MSESIPKKKKIVKKKVVKNKNPIDVYISQMTEQERLVLKIATEHLETSFDIEKSIGFQQWKESNNKT